jgi:hypothetical protein
VVIVVSYFSVSLLVFELISPFIIDGAINPPHFYYGKEEASAALFHYTGLLEHPNHHILNPEASLSAPEQNQGDALLLASSGPPAALGATEGIFCSFFALIHTTDIYFLSRSRNTTSISRPSRLSAHALLVSSSWAVKSWFQVDYEET